MTERTFNLVVPLGHKPTAMRTTETAGSSQAASGAAAREQIEAFLPATLHARLNPSKTILQPVDRGVDFVGHVIKPWHTRTRRRTYHEALRRTATVPAEDLHATANSYFGLLRQATHSHHDRARLANVARHRGHFVNFDLTKIYRRAAA